MTREEQRNKLVGKRFGRLVVLRFSRPEPGQGPMYICKCDCGDEKEIRGANLGKPTISCGCAQREWAESGGARWKGKGKPLGLSNTQVYHSWENMIDRCTNTKCKAYWRYGGAGISVDETWKVFENFYKDMGQPPTKKHTIDRIDGTNGYSKANCRWATRMEQQHNLKSNVNLTFKGKTLCRSEWARRIGISDDTLAYRLKSGWTKEEAFTTPAGERRGNQHGSRVTSGEQYG